MQEQTYIIYDNQDLSQLGLMHLIEQHIKTANIELAFDVTELKRLLESNTTASLIIDLEKSEITDVIELAEILSDFNKVSCLILISEINEHLIHDLSKDLAQANIALKTNSKDELFAALSATSLGKKYFCSEALDVILGNKSKKAEKSNKQDFSLTATEKEIVHLLAQGKSTKEIANERCLSYHTVITHRKNIFRKMEVNTVHELTKLALKNGLVDLTEYYI